LLQEFHTVIKNWNEKGISTAIGRTARWQPGRNPNPANSNVSDESQNLNGNAINAQDAAKKQSNAVSALKVFIFIKIINDRYLI
jgi:hypothetical protein